MCEADTQMRRSISMPSKPLQLEQKALKRSAEKENVFVSDDSIEEEDNTNGNYLRQGSSPAMVTESTEYQNMESTSTLHGLTKHLRSVRDFFANSMNPIFSIFRKTPHNNTNTTDINGTSEQTEAKATESNGQVNQHLDSNGKSNSDQNDGQIKSPEQERVVFSLS